MPANEAINTPIMAVPIGSEIPREDIKFEQPPTTAASFEPIPELDAQDP